MTLYLFRATLAVQSQDAEVVVQAESRQTTLPFTPEVANHVQVSSSQNGAVQVIPIENGDAQVKEELLNGTDSTIARYGSKLEFLQPSSGVLLQ